MGRSVVYCPICGGPFEDVSVGPVEGEYRDGVMDPSQTKWLSRFRVMGRASFTESRGKDYTPFAISPPASEAESRSVYIAGSSPATSEWGCMNGSKWRIFDQDAAGVVLYPVHDDCIEVLRDMAHRNSTRVIQNSFTKCTTIESYYEALLFLDNRNTEYPYESLSDQERFSSETHLAAYGNNKLEWEHGYYGSARFADGSTWYNEPGWEWICADFIEIPELTSYILRQLQCLNTMTQSRTFTQSRLPTIPIRKGLSVLPLTSVSGTTTPTLESLPSEIIQKMVFQLPITATLSLRRCSRSLASSICLDQIFWRNALLTGGLVPWLWDLDAQECHAKDQSGDWDWKQLGQTLRRAKIFESALRESAAGNDMDGIQRMVVRSVCNSDVTMSDAPIGLKNRCRLIRLVEDIERLFIIEGIEPTVMEEGVLCTPRTLSLMSDLSKIKA